MDMFRPGKNKVEFREIVLTHLKRILEISTQEFRGGYWKETPSGDFVIKEYVADTRKCYIQSIESLHDVLLPNFDTKIETAMEEINKELKELKENYDKSKTKTNEDIKNYIYDKLEISRKLFQQLNFLLKRKDYLKGTIYHEGVEDEDEDLDEDEITDTDAH